LYWAMSPHTGMRAIPYTLLALPLRAAAATVFWNSAMAKLVMGWTPNGDGSDYGQRRFAL
jgi:hypothetical protein